jgi:ribosomal protein S6--L-glutamate ligase
MKILVYGSEYGHGTKRILDEIEEANKTRKPGSDPIEGEFVQAFDLYSYISENTSGFDRIYKRAKEKSQKITARSYQAVIPRLAGSGFNFGMVNLRHLHRLLNVFSTGSDIGLKICSNKFLTCQVLSEHGIRVPRQVLAHRPTDYLELLNLVGWPERVVAKLQRGSQGAGVFILNDVLAASTALRAMEQASVDVVLSRFIDTGTPANDIRIIVIGAETENPKLFSFRRFSVDSDFRSNYSISGKGEPVKITDEERDMAIRSAKLLGLGIAGVDIMRDAKDKDKPFCIEVNGSPGLAGIEACTGQNVAKEIVRYVLDNYKLSGFKKQTTTAGVTNQAQPVTPSTEHLFDRIQRVKNDYLR